MPAPRILPTIDVLVKLREQGWTLQQIADEYGVTKGAVYLQFAQAGRTKARPNHKDLIPWTLDTKRGHAGSYPAMMLRALSRRRANEAEGLDPNDGIPEVKVRMLDRWLADLEARRLVVAYDRECPPNPADPKNGGWYYTPRRKSDDDVIRRPADKVVTLPEAGESGRPVGTPARRR